MDNFALVSLAENLRPLMTEDFIIRRVVQHQPNGFIFQTRSARFPALKVSMSARHPAFYPSETKPPVEFPNSDFLMVLRKHFTSAELVEFRKPLSERIVEMVFKTAVPSKELETMSLVLELIPNAPNLILLDAERRVLASFHPLSLQHGAGEFEPYAFPSAKDKTPLERIVSKEAVLPDTINDRAALIQNVAGLGPVFADEILFRCRKSGRPLADEILAFLELIQAPSHTARIYTEKPLGHILEQNDLAALGKAILSPVELLSLERTHSAREFGKITEAVRFYFDEIENRTLLEQAKQPLLRELRTAAKHAAEREQRVLREQQKYEDTSALLKTGQLLTAGGKNMDARYETVTVTDYYQSEPQEVTVALDSSLTLRENVERMFKKHQKAGRGAQILTRQLAQARARGAAVAEQLRRLQAIKDWDTWLAVSGRIAVEKQHPQGEAPAQEPAARRYRTLTVEGREILVGRSGRENDELTFHVAEPHDFWFHVAEYSGSHVIVRNPARTRDIPEAVLAKAAQLAAYHSQARNSSKVEVHYTMRKHVSKPRRGKPGLVKLAEFKSIAVEPRNWLEGE